MRGLMECFQTFPDGYAIKHAFGQLRPGNFESQRRDENACLEVTELRGAFECIKCLAGSKIKGYFDGECLQPRQVISDCTKGKECGREKIKSDVLPPTRMLHKHIYDGLNLP